MVQLLAKYTLLVANMSRAARVHSSNELSVISENRGVSDPFSIFAEVQPLFTDSKARGNKRRHS